MDWQYVGILLLSFFCFTSYSLPVSFFPIMAEKFGITSSLIGVILATFTVGGILMSLLLAKFMKIFGKRRLLTVSIITLAFTMVLFSTLEFIEDKNWFIVMSIVTRTIHGVSFGVIVSIAYAYIPVLYPDDMKKKIVLLEVVYGLSISFGAFVGEKLYEINGALIPFLSFAILYLLIIYPTLRILPIDKRNSSIMLLVDDEGTYEEEKIVLPYLPLAKSYSFISTILINYNYISLLSLLLVILPIHLIDQNEQTLNAYVFLLISGVYSLTTLLFSYGITLSYTNSMLIGTWVLTIGSVFIGPFIDIGIPTGNQYLLTGLSVFGFGAGIYFVILIPYLIEIATNIYKDQDEELVGDMVSGVFSASCFLGELVGPIAGGYLNEYIGFPRTTEILVLQSLIVSVNFLIYHIINLVMKAKNKKSMNEVSIKRISTEIANDLSAALTN